MNPSPDWFVLRGATLALAWFCVLNIAASVAVALTAGPLAGSLRTLPPSVWFSLRMFAACAATIFVTVVFLPSYWLYEPRDVSEGFDLLLTIGAGLTAVAAAAGVARGVSAWRSAGRRTRAWMQAARPLELPGTTVPAFEIDSDAPLLALVGVLRPRLLVTRGLIAALSPEELAASVAHEMGHSRAWDNLKRLAMRSAPDVFPPTAAMRALEERWVASSEHRADHVASEHDPLARCALASALVKVARLTPTITPLGEPISTLVAGGDIASRVRRLLDDRSPVSAGRLTRAAGWIAGLSLLAALALVYAPLLRGVHEVSELLVRSLP